MSNGEKCTCGLDHSDIGEIGRLPPSDPEGNMKLEGNEKRFNLAVIVPETGRTANAVGCVAFTGFRTMPIEREGKLVGMSFDSMFMCGEGGQSQQWIDKRTFDLLAAFLSQQGENPNLTKDQKTFASTLWAARQMVPKASEIMGKIFEKVNQAEADALRKEGRLQ